MKTTLYTLGVAALLASCGQNPQTPEATVPTVDTARIIEEAKLKEQREKDSLEQAARTAIGLDPNEAHYYFTHGVALAALGHVDQARQALGTSLRLEPGNPVARQRLDILNGAVEPVAEKKRRGWKLFGRKDD